MFDAIFPKHWTTLQRLMWLKTNALARAVYEIVTGNPVSFSARNAPLRQLKVAFSPVQSGTGDPSPTNVRPISGWDSLTVYHSGADTSNPQTISISLGQTVYSGLVDVCTGVGEVTWAACHIKDTTEIIQDVTTTDGLVFIVRPPMSQFAIIPSIYMFCSCYKFVNPNQMGANSHSGELGWYMAGPNRFCKIASLAQTVEEFRSELNTLDPVVVCPLETPIPIQLTPQEVNSLAGDNTMWTDADTLTVEYRSN